MRHGITLRPVYGIGGENALGLGMMGAYSYQLLTHGPMLEFTFQAGGFSHDNDQPQEGRRHYKYRGLFVGTGINVGTSLGGRFFANLGAGVSYYHGSEFNEYKQQVINQQGNVEQTWLVADRRYREPVFSGNTSIGIRLNKRWQVDLKGTLFTGIGGGNALLLIGP